MSEEEKKEEKVEAEAPQETVEATVKETEQVEPAEDMQEKQEEVEESPFPAKFILGRKVGMGRIFTDNGDTVSVTFVEAGPCTVTQIKTDKTDGYNAVQLAFGSKKEKLINKPTAGHLKKSNLDTTRYLKEVRLKSVDEVKLGQQIKANIFSVGDIVHVTGVSKGLGFQGTVRRHKFAGGDKTHGQSDRHRAPGSIGQSSSPSRVFKGVRMAGRMGGDTITVKNLKIVGVDIDKNYLLIEGSIPGKSKNLVKVFVPSYRNGRI